MIKKRLNYIIVDDLEDDKPPKYKENLAFWFKHCFPDLTKSKHHHKTIKEELKNESVNDIQSKR